MCVIFMCRWCALYIVRRWCHSCWTTWSWTALVIALTGRLWSCTHARRTVISQDSTARSSSGSKTSSLNINSRVVHPPGKRRKSGNFKSDRGKARENRQKWVKMCSYWWCVTVCNQGDHKPGKPRVLGHFYKRGTGEFCAIFWDNFNKQNSFSSIKYLLNTTRSWGFKWTKSGEFRRWSQCVGDLLYCWSWCGTTLDIWRSLLHEVSCDNLCKSSLWLWKKPGKFGGVIFSYFVVTLIMRWKK